jgi:hypothetical protein
MQQQHESRRVASRKFASWVLAGVIAGAVPVIAPLPAHAADNAVEVSPDKAPPAVVAAVRTEVPDGQDVVYSKMGAEDHYRVGVTDPSGIRLRLSVRSDGTMLREAELAENQPKGAPKGRDAREQLLATHNQRAVAARTARMAPGVPPTGVASTPPAAAVPAAVPAAAPGVLPIPGDLPQLPTATSSAPVSATDLPGAVVQSFDRFTAGARDVRYFRQQAGTGTRYEADYTAADNSRRQIIVADNGSLVAGPLVVRDTVEDRDLLTDRSEGAAALSPADTRRVEARDVPPRALAVFDRYTQRATDVRYRRDTFVDRSVGYTVHWVQPDNGRRYWTTVREDGQVAIAPRLSGFQPDSQPDTGGVRATAVAWRDIPDRVQQTLQPLAGKDRNAVYTRQVRDGNKVFYGAEYRENGRDMWVRVDESGRTVAGPVLAESGKAADNDARPAAARLPGRDADAPSNTVRMADLPEAVRQTVQIHTQGAKSVQSQRYTEDGRPAYRVTWTDAQGDSHQMRVGIDGKQIVEQPAAKTPAPRR